MRESSFYAISERDMDMLLLEEISSSDAFRAWFLNKLFGADCKATTFLGAWHKLSYEALGTVDIVFSVADDAGRKYSVLIENKLDQPNKALQAERYFEIGEKGTENGDWNDYITCLFAPKKYFSNLHSSEYFASYLSYEEMYDWFDGSRLGVRGNYKRRLVKEAIEQSSRGEYRVPPTPERQKFNLPEGYKVFPAGALNVSDGYQVVETVPVSSFLKDYKLFSDQYFPKLKMQDPKTLAYPGLDWALFRPVEFPREVNVIHKIPQGFMDLSFTLTTMDRVQELFGPLLGSDMSIRETGKACVIRMNVPAIVRPESFEKEKDLIAFSMQKAKRLHALYCYVMGRPFPYPNG